MGASALPGLGLGVAAGGEGPEISESRSPISEIRESATLQGQMRDGANAPRRDAPGRR